MRQKNKLTILALIVIGIGCMTNPLILTFAAELETHQIVSKNELGINYLDDNHVLLKLYSGSFSNHLEIVENIDYYEIENAENSYAKIINAKVIADNYVLLTVSRENKDIEDSLTIHWSNSSYGMSDKDIYRWKGEIYHDGSGMRIESVTSINDSTTIQFDNPLDYREAVNLANYWSPELEILDVQITPDLKNYYRDHPSNN